MMRKFSEARRGAVSATRANRAGQANEVGRSEDAAGDGTLKRQLATSRANTVTSSSAVTTASASGARFPRMESAALLSTPSVPSTLPAALDHSDEP